MTAISGGADDTHGTGYTDNYYSLALKSDGTVRSWGYNYYGDLGNGTTTTTGCECFDAAVLVSGLSGVTTLTSMDGAVEDNEIGAGVSLALKSDGTLWAWGTNGLGNVGNGTITTTGCGCIPSPVQTSISGVAQPPPPTQQALSGGPITEAENPTGNFCFVCFLRALAEALAGDPVNTAYGSFIETATDIALSGRGLPLSFSRTYDSAAAATDGPLGYGWTANVFMSLSQPGGTGPVTITQEGDAQVLFNQIGTSYVPAASRDIATLTQNLDGTWTFVRTAHETFVFSATGLLSSANDLNGYVTTYGYNGSNQLTTITDPAARTLSLGWTGANITSVTDANVSPSRTATFQYNDGSGNLTDVIDVNGGHTHLVYDGNHRLINLFDPDCYAAGSGCNGGSGVVNHYNTSGQVDWQKDQLGRQTSFVYAGSPSSATGSTTTTTDPKGNVTLDTYQFGVRTAETRGYGTSSAATWSYTYDPITASLLTATDPNGRTAHYGMDSSGNQLWETDPLGRLSQATYNAFNEPLTQTDALSLVTTYTYDRSGNLLSVSRPLLDSGGHVLAEQVTMYHHTDPSNPGDVTSMVDPDSSTWTYGYDNYGDVSSFADPLGDIATTSYNADGWKLSSVSPRGNVSGCGCASQYTTTYGYIDTVSGKINEFGDAATVTDPLDHVTANHYDADRNLTSTTDPNGNTESYTYDLANEKTVTTRSDHTTRHTDYNLDGTVLDEKDGKNNPIMSYGYDSLARVTSSTDALNNVTTYGYDLDGNQTTKQDPGGNCNAVPKTGCTTATYDADSEALAVSYSDGTTPNVTNATYDAVGERTSSADGTGTSTWGYDSLHRLTSYQNGTGAIISYDYLTPAGGYDLKVQVGHITYPNSAGKITQGWDAAGRLSSVQDWNGKTTGFVFDPNSNLTTESVPSSTPITDSIVFNAADQMTSSLVSNGSTLFSATYTRDSDGQLAMDTSQATSQGQYRYTGLNQLCYAGSGTSGACANPPSGSYPYAYDAADNLTTMENAAHSGTNTQQFNSADELCWTVTGTSGNSCITSPAAASIYQYDTHGNRTSLQPSTGNATCYTYDQANRLKAIATYRNSTCSRPTSVAAYAYNGDGLRMSKTVGTATTQFAWDESSRSPLILQATTGTSIVNYIYGPGDLPIEQIASGMVNWLHHDQLGSTRLMTDTSGSVAWTSAYDPYGNLVASTGTATTSLTFSGAYRDSESGLLYLRARYYDPITGQFVSRDPMVATTREPYAYVHDNPLNATDPKGLTDAEDGVGELVSPETFAVELEIAIEDAPLIAEQEAKACAEAQVAENDAAAAASNTFAPNSLTHIFRDIHGHLAEDSPARRQMFLNTAQNYSDRLGTDQFGNDWYTTDNTDGSQTWVRVRNGRITDAGVNPTPWAFDPSKGLVP